MTAKRSSKAKPAAKAGASRSGRIRPPAAPARPSSPPSPPPSQPDKALDPTQIVASDFIAGAGTEGSLPPPVSAEVAFAGRSNVGKSSLINTLVERKGLVRTSSTPGSTRQINLYEARARDSATFHLVDLPGYGFTRRSKGEKAAWATLIEAYLRGRVTLAAVLLLVDARRGVEPDDLELVEFVEGARGVDRRPVEVILVATKLDKVPRSAQRRALAQIAASTPPAAGGGARKVIGFSAITGEGKTDLWRAIRLASLGPPPTQPIDTTGDGHQGAPAAQAAPPEGEPPPGEAGNQAG